MKIHTAEPSPFEAKISFEVFKSYKLSGTNQILAELIQAGYGTLHFEIHTLTNSFGIRKHYISTARNLLQQLFTRWVIEITVVIHEVCDSQRHTTSYSIFFFQDYVSK
jgi:hypothetical protein